MMNFDFLSKLSPVDDATVEAWEQQEKANGIKERLKKLMPYGSEGKTFESFVCETEKQKNLLTLCKKASEKIKTGGFLTLCLLGSYGIGKTHLSYAIMRDVILTGEKKKVHYFTEKGNEQQEVFTVGMTAKYNLIPELIEKYQGAKSFSSRETMMDVIKDATDADLIILDEIGRSFNPALEKEVLYRVFNECWINRKSAVVISNMKFKEFTTHVGGASMDRLKDSAVFPDLDNLTSFRGKK